MMYVYAIFASVSATLGMCMIACARTLFQVSCGAAVLLIALFFILVTPADAATPVQVTVSVTVDDPELNEPYVRQLVQDASALVADLGVTFEVVQYETNDPAPGITDADRMLEAIRLYRKRQIGNVYLLITRRAILVSGHQFVGFASNGPACTMVANAIARPAPQTIAHELLHTMGISHDPEIYGYLMSPAGVSTTISDYTREQFTQGDYTDCGDGYKPQGQSAQAATRGGGGAMDVGWIGCIALLVAWAVAVKEVCRQRAEIKRLHDTCDAWEKMYHAQLAENNRLHDIIRKLAVHINQVTKESDDGK